MVEYSAIKLTWKVVRWNELNQTTKKVKWDETNGELKWNSIKRAMLSLHAFWSNLKVFFTHRHWCMKSMVQSMRQISHLIYFIFRLQFFSHQFGYLLLRKKWENFSNIHHGISSSADAIQRHKGNLINYAFNIQCIWNDEIDEWDNVSEIEMESSVESSRNTKCLQTVQFVEFGQNTVDMKKKKLVLSNGKRQTNCSAWHLVTIWNEVEFVMTFIEWFLLLLLLVIQTKLNEREKNCWNNIECIWCYSSSYHTCRWTTFFFKTQVM